MTAEDTPNMNWSEVVKKEARGTNDEDLGEVQEVGQHYILVQKGLINKDRFYIPKALVEGYDGEVLWFRITEEQAKASFLKESPPRSDEYERYKTDDLPSDFETRIPVMGERLKVQKKTTERDVGIVKEPVTETKTVEVPVTHEEVTVERRPASGTVTTKAGERPVDSRQEVKVPLKSEEVEVTKEPYVKEEVAVKKRPVTETREVSEELTSERVDVEK
jgi:uncharacterized protein (TIGR02271 family)